MYWSVLKCIEVYTECVLKCILNVYWSVLKCIECVLKCIECVFPALYILHIRHTDWLSMAGHSQTNGSGRHPRLHMDPSQNTAKCVKTWTHKKLQEIAKFAKLRLHTDPSTKHCKIVKTHKKLQELQCYPRLHMDPSTKHCKIAKLVKTWYLSFCKAPAQP